VRKTDNPTTILDHCHVIWEPSGHLGPVMGLIYFFNVPANDFTALYF